MCERQFDIAVQEKHGKEKRKTVISMAKNIISVLKNIISIGNQL